MMDEAEEECWDIPESLPAQQPAMPPAAGGPNELLEEEKAWVVALDAASREAGLLVRLGSQG
jgi:hypothetical protein